jgi:hypothetical protein
MSEWQAFNDPDMLKGNIESSNKKLKRTLKEDQHHEKLLGLVKTDWGLDRMTEPVIGASELPSGVLFHPRFAVEQTRTDGSLKYRAVDNLSWAAEPVKAAKDAGRSHKFATKLNSVNGHVFPAEKMKHESIDMMVDLLKTHVKKHKKAPHLWKADIDAAFRRVSVFGMRAFIMYLCICSSLQIPIAPEDRWACGIAFESDGKTVTSQHITAPFGSVASVHAWERIGAALAHLARHLIKLPVLRYVDDFFGPERHAPSYYYLA